MKKILTIIAMALTMFNATANAKLNFGLKGGLNLSSASLNGPITDNFDSKNQAGFFVGPTVRYKLPVGWLGFDAAVFYNQTQTKVEDTSLKNQSIAVPVNIRIKPIPAVPVFIFAGPQIDVAIGDKQVNFDNVQSNVKNFNFKNTYLSANVGLGVEISKFQVEVNYNIACGKTGEFDIAEIGGDQWREKMKHNTWQVSLAYYF